MSYIKYKRVGDGIRKHNFLERILDCIKDYSKINKFVDIYIKSMTSAPCLNKRLDINLTIFLHCPFHSRSSYFHKHFPLFLVLGPGSSSLSISFYLLICSIWSSYPFPSFLILCQWLSNKPFITQDLVKT